MRVVCSADTYTRSSHPNRGVALSLTPDRLAPPLSAVAKLNCNIDDNGEAYFKPRARIEKRASEKNERETERERERERGRERFTSNGMI